MVTFRFYLVSIVAFFLALAVGVVVGSVLDEGISNSLKDRLERVETNLDDTVASIDDKNREIDDLERYSEASAPYAVEHRLDGTSSLVVAEPGIDSDPVEDLVVRLRQAGSHISGIVWLDQRWDLTDDEDKGRFAEILDAGDVSVDELHRSAWSAVLATTPSGGGTGTTTTTAVDGEVTTTGVDTTTSVADGEPVDVFANDTLVQLEDAGFLRLVRIDGDDAVGGAELAVVSVTGSESTLETPGSAASAVADRSAALELPTVLAEVYVDNSSDDEDPPPRGLLVRAAVGDSSSKFSTVDDLDLVAGRVATALALSDQRTGVVGHFGYGPDVDGVLPRWPGP
jgi:Copper transport outer membrane protein, MctB